ncbi:MAG: flagellar basal body rod protein FlgB [Burkholderiales bacterium]|nr:flagellar basal body rod protein FlgB [Burkholderiales bacterium]
MISLIESNTTALLSLALDAAGMRQQAIAHNIANANAPGYRPLSVTFEERLVEARNALSNGQKAPLSSFANYRPTIDFVQPSGIDEAKVSVDTEVAKLSETVLHHQVLLKALNRHFSILNSAISEGKR